METAERMLELRDKCHELEQAARDAENEYLKSVKRALELRDDGMLSTAELHWLISRKYESYEAAARRHLTAENLLDKEAEKEARNERINKNSYRRTGEGAARGMRH